MTRRGAARTRMPRSPKPGSVLERLEAEGGQQQPAWRRALDWRTPGWCHESGVHFLRERDAGSWSSWPVAAAALTVRWGSDLAVLLDHDKPLWPEVLSARTSRISDAEMARINIEASAALAGWIDIYREDPGGRLYGERRRDKGPLAPRGWTEHPLSESRSPLRADATELRVVTEVDIVGRLGPFGASVLRGKADRMWDEFVANPRARIE